MNIQQTLQQFNDQLEGFFGGYQAIIDLVLMIVVGIIVIYLIIQ